MFAHCTDPFLVHIVLTAEVVQVMSRSRPIIFNNIPHGCGGLFFRSNCLPRSNVIQLMPQCRPPGKIKTVQKCTPTKFKDPPRISMIISMILKKKTKIMKTVGFCVFLNSNDFSRIESNQIHYNQNRIKRKPSTSSELEDNPIHFGEAGLCSKNNHDRQHIPQAT